MENTVLIVDEDANARIIAETLLRSRGLKVRGVADGAEACEIMRQEGVTVVVLDLTLPGMNGLEVIRAVRARFGALPMAMQPGIVVVTKRKDPDVERFTRRLGADAFLPKPLAPGPFISTVEQLMTAVSQRDEVRAHAC